MCTGGGGCFTFLNFIQIKFNLVFNIFLFLHLYKLFI